MAEFADKYGVAEWCDELASWIWGAEDSWQHGIGEQRFTDTQACLQAFWNAASNYPADDPNVRHLDGIAHRVLGFIYHMRAATAPVDQVKGLMQQAIQEFQYAIADFDSVQGDEAMANVLRKIVGQAPATAQEWVDTAVDTSFLAAVRETAEGYANAAKSGITTMTGAIGSSMKWIGIGVGVVGLAWLLGRK